jgi:hypothetical protein
MKVTLARALKLKNQAVREVTTRAANVQKHNSHRVDNKVNYSAADEMALLKSALDKLISIKATIAISNGPIYEKIHRMGELKGFIQHLRSIDTKEGKESLNRGYGQPEKEVEYVVTYSDKAVEAMIREVEKQLEALQDEIDGFNHKTLVEIPE